jgi:hypothetical protein
MSFGRGGERAAIRFPSSPRTAPSRGRRFAVAGLALLAALLAFSAQNLPGATGSAQAGGENYLYVPLVIKPYPPPTVFGAELGAITDTQGLQQVTDANTSWVRRASVEWRDVEATEGVRDWAALSGLEQELIRATNSNMRVVLVVSHAPDWALVNPTYVCGKVKTAKMDALASFVHELVLRYSAFPYNVKYWEMWNEPDVSPSQAPAEGYFGCWGDSLDINFGGGYYAQMLQHVYPQIKSADAQAQVLVGGLLLDCDPTLPISAAQGCPDSDAQKPPKFLTGILQGGGGPYFDGVSFHAYDYYQGTQGRYGNSNWGTAWNTYGPVVAAKAGYLRQLLNNASVTGKYLMSTESALLCDPVDPPDQSPCISPYEDTKAYYVAEVYASAMSQGLQTNVWYSPLGWRNSGLLNSDLTPRPAYTAYAFARGELRDATNLGSVAKSDVGGTAGIKGYKFNRGDRKVWVLWSLDGGNHLAQFSGTPLAVYDYLGVSSTPSSSQVVMTAPLYVEWP